VWWKAGGFVVLLAATVVTIVLVGRPDPRESAHTTADLVAGSLTNADGTAYTSYLCGFNPDPPGFVDQAGATTVLSVAEGNQGVATATLTANRLPELGLVLLLHNESGSRCVEALTLCPLDGSVPGMSAEDASRCRFRPGR
jgi:hypothetical protein